MTRNRFCYRLFEHALIVRYNRCHGPVSKGAVALDRLSVRKLETAMNLAARAPRANREIYTQNSTAYPHMSTLTAIILSCLLIVSLVLTKLSRSLMNDGTIVGLALGHMCDVVGDYLFAVVAGLVLLDLINRLF